MGVLKVIVSLKPQEVRHEEPHLFPARAFLMFTKPERITEVIRDVIVILPISNPFSRLTKITMTHKILSIMCELARFPYAYFLKKL